MIQPRFPRRGCLCTGRIYAQQKDPINYNDIVIRSANILSESIVFFESIVFLVLSHFAFQHQPRQDGPAPDAQFGVNVLQCFFDGRFFDYQFPGDLLIGQAGCDQVGDFEFPGG
jgi:hypothetical protein